MTKQGRHKGIEERSGSDGQVSYRAKVRVKGFPAQSATFVRLTDAVRWRQQTEADIRRGKYFQTVEARKHTFGELVDRYIATVLPRKPKSEKKQKAQLLFWKKQIRGDRLLCDINTSLIVEIRDKLLNGITYRHTKRSPACVNRYLSILGHLFSTGISEFQWLTDSPVKKLKLKESGGRTRTLSDDERDRLLQACKSSKNKYLYLVVLITLSVGCRLMEVMSLQFDDIIWGENNSCILRFKNTKNSSNHEISLLGPAKDLLAEHVKVRPLNNNFVFPAKRGFKPRPAVIRASFQAALAQAKIGDGFSFHSLRHTFGSWCGRIGIGESIIGKILNHKSNVTKKYIHLSNPHLQEALEKMNNTFLAKEVSQ